MAVVTGSVDEIATLLVRSALLEPLHEGDLEDAVRYRSGQMRNVEVLSQPDIEDDVIGEGVFHFLGSKLFHVIRFELGRVPVVSNSFNPGRKSWAKARKGHGA